MSAPGKTDQLERRGWKEGREKSYCGRTDVFLSPLDSFFITSLNFKAFGTQPLAGSLEEQSNEGQWCHKSRLSTLEFYTNTYAYGNMHI